MRIFENANEHSLIETFAVTAEDFAIYHPAGQLGRKLIKVSEAMTFRRGENLPVASDKLTVGEVLLYESRLSPKGSTYSVLERFPLRNA